MRRNACTGTNSLFGDGYSPLIIFVRSRDIGPREFRASDVPRNAQFGVEQQICELTRVAGVIGWLAAK